MSKPKYPFEKRLEVVNHYFTTDDGYRIISARFGVPRTQVRTWVALYEKHGEKGLIPKPKGVSADPELRIKVYGSTTYCNFYSHVKYSPLASSVRVIYVAFCCYTAPDIQPFFD
ncbi:hypothetical protein BIU79_07785 [Klebsiella pneumoniae]|nr:hypothetical protein B7979_23390 [Escherichia coli]PAQ67681.1 hypothetical protein BIU79_07785 [Klebsiella pneumoniae]